MFTFWDHGLLWTKTGKPKACLFSKTIPQHKTVFSLASGKPRGPQKSKTKKGSQPWRGLTLNAGHCPNFKRGQAAAPPARSAEPPLAASPAPGSPPKPGGRPGELGSIGELGLQLPHTRRRNLQTPAKSEELFVAYWKKLGVFVAPPRKVNHF